MAKEELKEPGTLATDAAMVRTIQEGDLGAVVAIDEQASDRRRPQYGLAFGGQAAPAT